MPTANELSDLHQILTALMDQRISCTNETSETLFATAPLDIANTSRHLLATGCTFKFLFGNHISILQPVFGSHFVPVQTLGEVGGDTHVDGNATPPKCVFKNKIISPNKVTQSFRDFCYLELRGS